MPTAAQDDKLSDNFGIQKLTMLHENRTSQLSYFQTNVILFCHMKSIHTWSNMHEAPIVMLTAR